MKNNEKIKAVRTELGMTLDEFSRGLDVGKSLISMVEKGTKPATVRLIRDILRVYKVNQKWWDSGEGDIFELQPGQKQKEESPLEADLRRLVDQICDDVLARVTTPQEQMELIEAFLAFRRKVIEKKESGGS